MSIITTFIVPHPPLIIPDIGRGEESRIQDTINSYHEIAKRIGEIKPDTIIISSPHAHCYRDYFYISPGATSEGDFSRFGAPQVKFKVNYDESLINKISSVAKQEGVLAGTEGGPLTQLDHGTMVPLYFINQYCKSYKLIVISPSGLSANEHLKFGKLIQSVIPEDKKVVFVASGDLSHKLKEEGPYGLAKEGPIFDEKFVEIISKGNLSELLKIDRRLVSKASECGLNSFIMMSGVLDGYQVESKLLSYEGPFGVGYAVAMYEVLQQDESRKFAELYEEKGKDNISTLRQKEDPYVMLARQSLEYYVKHKRIMSTPSNLIDDLVNNKAGVFVSLHKNDLLRGCTGTIKSTTNCIADEIIHNAISAGMMDPRFSSVKRRELPYLQYKVDVLLPAEKIDSIEELDVKKYGVIVYHNHKSGLLLPNLDGIDTVEEQVSIAKRKAGIKENEPFRMERFEVIRHY